MKLPKEIIIGESVWKIVSKRVIEDPAGGKNETVGLCDYNRETIFIKTGQSFEDKLMTLIHEILHVFYSEYDIDVPHQLIYKLERPIAQLIWDNFLK